MEDLESAVYHLDEPMTDLSAIPLMLICRKAKETVTVVLSGEGGDEIFAGYDRFKASKAAGYLQPPARLRPPAAPPGLPAARPAPEKGGHQRGQALFGRLRAARRRRAPALAVFPASHPGRGAFQPRCRRPSSTSMTPSRPSARCWPHCNSTRPPGPGGVSGPQAGHGRQRAHEGGQDVHVHLPGGAGSLPGSRDGGASPPAMPGRVSSSRVSPPNISSARPSGAWCPIGWHGPGQAGLLPAGQEPSAGAIAAGLMEGACCTTSPLVRDHLQPARRWSYRLMSRASGRHPQPQPRAVGSYERRSLAQTFLRKLDTARGDVLPSP